MLGKVRGNVSASDRVDIRAEGALSGDVAAARISIEDGAFFKGGIDIRKADAKPAQAAGAVGAGGCDAGHIAAAQTDATIRPNRPAVRTLQNRFASGRRASAPVGRRCLRLTRCR